MSPESEGDAQKFMPCAQIAHLSNAEACWTFTVKAGHAVTCRLSKLTVATRDVSLKAAGQRLSLWTLLKPPDTA